MRCIKTGCDAFLIEYGEWVHGDAFRTESGDLVIRCCARRRERWGLRRRHFTVLKIDHWFDDNRTSVAVNSTLFANAGMFTDHGYDGIEERGKTLPDALG